MLQGRTDELPSFVLPFSGYRRAHTQVLRGFGITTADDVISVILIVRAPRPGDTLLFDEKCSKLLTKGTVCAIH